jgi:ABC-type glycerol-3-phosphate transport system permease component
VRPRAHGVSVGRTAILVVAALPFLYPFVFLVGTALKPLAAFNENSVNLPSNPTLDNIGAAWTEASLGWAMLHSLLAVGVGVAATVAVSAAGAFWFFLHESRPARVLRYVLIGTIALPPPVFIIPLFVLLSDHSATDNLLVLGLVYAGWNASFGLYLIYTYFKGLPRDVIEAARVDGASLLQLLWRVMLPLSRPVLATLAVLSFIWSWSDLLISIVLVQDPSRRLLTPATALLSDQYSTDIPKQAAGVLIAVLPMLFVFLLGQRSLVRGVAAGVGK